MAKLIYITNTSLDGYIEDAAGNFDWPSSDETYALFTRLLGQMGTLIYGRRLYEMMAYWGSPVEKYPQERRAFAEIWQRPDKWVYSRTLTETNVANTRLFRDFDPDLVRELKQKSSQDISIGGAELATLALNANLIDEFHVVVHPIMVGGGKPAFKISSRHDFRLLETQRFDTGAVYMHYEIQSGASR